VDKSQVSITEITDASKKRRSLLGGGVDVTTKVLVPASDAKAVASVTASLKPSNAGALGKALAASMNDPALATAVTTTEPKQATVTITAPSEAVKPPPAVVTVPAPAEDNGRSLILGVGIGVGVGVGVGVPVVVSIVAFIIYKNSRKSAYKLPVVRQRSYKLTKGKVFDEQKVAPEPVWAE